MKLLALLFFPLTVLAQNTVYIDQVGNYNQISVVQEGTGHLATLTLGQGTGLDTTAIGITQQGTGSHTATLEITGGYNNSFSVNQDGGGNHTATVQNFTGAANSVSINQSGNSSNSFTLTGSGTNNANTVSATQSGNVGADKSFSLNMINTTGATVTVQQTNPTQANSGSMTIQCSSLCGNYSYIRN